MAEYLVSNGGVKVSEAGIPATALAPGVGNPVIAGCTVAANGTVTMDKNIASVVAPHDAIAYYAVTLTANTATKYAAFVTAAVFGVDLQNVQAERQSATLWWVYATEDGGGAIAASFNFTVLSFD